MFFRSFLSINFIVRRKEARVQSLTSLSDAVMEYAEGEHLYVWMKLQVLSRYYEDFSKSGWSSRCLQCVRDMKTEENSISLSQHESPYCCWFLYYSNVIWRLDFKFSTQSCLDILLLACNSKLCFSRLQTFIALMDPSTCVLANHTNSDTFVAWRLRIPVHTDGWLSSFSRIMR